MNIIGQMDVFRQCNVCSIEFSICEKIFIPEWNEFTCCKRNGKDEFYIHMLPVLNDQEGIEYITYKGKTQGFRLEDAVVLADSKWKEISILLPSDSQLVSYIIMRIFYTHAIQRRIIQFHSSLIDMQGRGLMFLGPSGIGKTTQAELWNRYRDALIINGDIVFVQETEGGFLGWGTPWHGSSPYCENASVPVAALIVLKQAPENSIRELTGFEKVTAVSNNVFYPRWLENGMELCLDVLDHLLRALPVYELSCRPDEEAVALTEKTIFGENRKW